MSTSEVHWFSDDILEFVYRGRVTLEDLRAMVNETRRLTREQTPRVQLVDTLAVTGVPKEIGAVLGELLEDYRAQGGTWVVMIATDQMNAMLGRSMSFGAGVKLQLVGTRADALRFISTLRDA